MILLLALALAQADPYRSVVDPPVVRAEATFEGAFDTPPVPHWRVQLPGPVLNAAAHTEHTRPTVHGARIYVGSAAGTALYALDRRTGAVLQTYPADASVESEARIDGDRVYFTDTGGHTWCYTLGGELLWSHATAAPMLVRPTIHDGRVFVTNVDDLVVALEADTGKLIWRFQQQPDVTRRAELTLYAAPPAVVSGDNVWVGFSEGSVLALSAATGDPRWTLRVGEGRYPDVVAPPLTVGGMVYVSGYFEPLLAVDLDSRKVQWSSPHGAAAPPIVHAVADGARLVHPGTDGKLRSFDAHTGREVWTWDSGDSGALTEPLDTPAGLLVASSTGTVSLVDPDTGAKRWAFRPPFVLEGVSTAPVVDGRQLLFLTNAGNLYSLVVPAPPAEPDPRATWRQ